MAKITVAEAMEAICTADKESLLEEIAKLRLDIALLAKQMRQKEHAIGLLEGLLTTNQYKNRDIQEDSDDENELAEEVAVEEPTEVEEEPENDGIAPDDLDPRQRDWPSPSKRWHRLHAILMRDGPATTSELAKKLACGASYQTTYTDLTKREGHYFKRLADKRWEAVDIELPSEPEDELE